MIQEACKSNRTQIKCQLQPDSLATLNSENTNQSQLFNGGPASQKAPASPQKPSQ